MRTSSLYSILATLLLAACGEPAHGQRPENPRHYYYQISPSNAPLKTEEAIYSPRPDYPIKVRQRHLTGSGLFAVHIRADGRVGKVTVLRSTGHPELDEGAIESLREWQFPPRSIRVVRVPIRYVAGPRPKHIIPLPLKNPGDGADIGIFSIMSAQPSPSPSQEYVVYAPPPEYPREARRQHLEGTGLYAAHLLADGTVASVEIVKSASPILDQAAIFALRKWRYRPSKSTRVIKIPLTVTMSSYRGR